MKGYRLQSLVAIASFSNCFRFRCRIRRLSEMYALSKLWTCRVLDLTNQRH